MYDKYEYFYLQLVDFQHALLGVNGAQPLNDLLLNIYIDGLTIMNTNTSMNNYGYLGSIKMTQNTTYDYLFNHKNYLVIQRPPAISNITIRMRQALNNSDYIPGGLNLANSAYFINIYPCVDYIPPTIKDKK